MNAKYLIRTLGWGVVFGASLAALILWEPTRATIDDLSNAAVLIVLAAVLGTALISFVESLFKAFGYESAPEPKPVTFPGPNEGGWRVIRLSVLLKLFFFVGSAGLLGLSGFLILLLATKTDWTLKNFGLAMAMVPFLVIGLCGLVLPFRWRVRYNVEQVCMRFTSWRPDERCARWRDLDRIKWSSGNITLIFLGGRKLRTTEWMPGGSEIQARAEQALDENRRRGD